MFDKSKKIKHLGDKLGIILQQQQYLYNEINELKREINEIQPLTDLPPVPGVQQDAVQAVKAAQEAVVSQPPTSKPEIKPPTVPQKKTEWAEKITAIRANLEKYIGEHLINIIGILILVIGVGIGAKYAIDNDLISPLTRIVLGYFVGFVLLGFALRLRKKFQNFSAVLLSGAMAILYFISYAAFSFYQLIPYRTTFLLMVVFTVFTVLAALKYNKQVIAIIGMVGAYAVPFILWEEPVNAHILFTYMAIINIGILVIAFTRYWKTLYYCSFILTWIIFANWYYNQYNGAEDFNYSLIFLAVFFISFYLTILAYKLIRKEKFEYPDVLLLLINSFIFYGFGYSILNGETSTSHLLGLFTLINASIHSMVSLAFYRDKLTDRNLFLLVLGLALVFITITIPVQLNGNWVTLLWVGEAALLFWIGRTRNISFYEKISYPLMWLAFFSILQDWTETYFIYYNDNGQTPIPITPVFNINFLSTLLFAGTFSFIVFLNRDSKYTSAFQQQKLLNKLLSFSLAAILFISVYILGWLEIELYFNHRYLSSAIEVKGMNDNVIEYKYNEDIFPYKIIWQINYTLVFLSVCALLNIKKIRNQQAALINLALNTIALFVLSNTGLLMLDQLRKNYLEQTMEGYFESGYANLLIRYFVILLAALLLYSTYQLMRQDFVKHKLKIPFDFLLHITILAISGNELINWLDITGSAKFSGMSLSLLWGLYSLLLIVLGIWKKKKHIRIGAIILFGLTLMKLFLYDLAYLDTIAKTIVFIVLGALLLIISFLYTRYRHIISEEFKE